MKSRSYVAIEVFLLYYILFHNVANVFFYDLIF